MDLKIALSQHVARPFVLAVFALSFVLVLVGTAPAVLNCPGTISANYTLSEDISQTSSGTCITVTASNVTVNLSGHSVICNRVGSSCDTALVVNNSLSNVTIRNGYIVGNSHQWATGISNGGSGGVNNDLTVTDVTIDNAGTGIAGPGHLVQNSVFKNISAYCINSGGQMPDGGKIWQNFCDSTGLGILVDGPSSSSDLSEIVRNYVRAGSIWAGISNNSGYVLIEHNVIDSGSPFIGEGANATLSGNLCDDDTDCPLPDSNFSFNLSFDE